MKLISQSIPELKANSEIKISIDNRQLCYTVLSSLTKGKNCRSYLAKDQIKNIDVVIKQFGQNMLKEQLENDAKFMEASASPVIAQGYEHFIYNNLFTIVMKYYQNGTLQQYFDDTAQGKHNSMDLDKRTLLCRRLAQSVAYLHSKGLVHRAISPQNIFVADDGQNLILSEFGSIVEDADMNPNQKKNKAGNKMIETIAPEILKEQSYTKAADIWSVGCVMYYIVKEVLPFTDVDENALVSTIKAGNYVKLQINNISKVIDEILVLDATKRPTIETIVKKLDTSVPIQVLTQTDTKEWVPQSYKVNSSDKIIDLKQKIISLDFQNKTPAQMKICFFKDGEPDEQQELVDEILIIDYLSMRTERVLNIECVIILDKSGSMDSYTKNIQDAFHEFIKQMQQLKQNIFITLEEFSDRTRMKTIFKHTPAQQISLLKPLDYVAYGETALRDAIGQEIVSMSEYISQKSRKVDLVTFFIITDGEDNDSESFDEKVLKDMIGDAIKMGWVFDFTGPQDKRKIEKQFGIPQRNVTLVTNGKEASAAFTQIKTKIRNLMINNSVLAAVFK